MGKSALITGLLFVLPLSLFGQVKQDKREITRLENGQYSFVEGAVQVTFTDTTSEATARQVLEEAGYKILQLKIYPITAQTIPNLHDTLLAKISTHPWVEEVGTDSFGFSEEAFEEMVKRDSLSQEEAEAARQRFESMAETVYTRIKLKSHVTPGMAEELTEEFREVGFKLNMVIPRTAVVESRVGEESDTMRQLKKLPVVKNTAFIGRIESN